MNLIPNTNARMPSTTPMLSAITPDRAVVKVVTVSVGKSEAITYAFLSLNKLVFKNASQEREILGAEGV